MYNSMNLPLSPRKVVKKIIAGRTLSFAVFYAFGFLIMWLSFTSFWQSSPNPSKEVFPYFPYILGIFIGIAVLNLTWQIVYQYLYYRWYFYDFSDETAEIRKGVVSRQTGHVRYDRLQNVYMDQDFWDRIFGLYDVHYETAEERSSFYSHVDGLEKRNADILYNFLKEKTKTSQTNSALGSSQVPIESVAQSPQSLLGPTALSRENLPIEKRVIALKIIGKMIGWLILYGFALFLPPVKFHLVTFIIIMAVLAIVSWIHTIIWFKNFYFSFTPQGGEVRSRVLTSSNASLSYERIQNVNLTQGIFERFMGLSTVSIETAGEMSGRRFLISGLATGNAGKLKSFLLERAKAYKGL